MDLINIQTSLSFRGAAAKRRGEPGLRCASASPQNDAECDSKFGNARLVLLLILPARSEPVTENVAVCPPFDMTAEPEFQLRAVEWRLFQFLLRIRERLNLEHDECVPG